MKLLLRWFLSSTVRRAVELRRQVRKLVNHQRDVLNPKSIDAIRSELGGLQAVLADGDSKTILESCNRLEQVATRFLLAYPHASYRENVEVLLVAVAVAMAIRTYFLQPFKIPTGSMQPTLFGITSEDFRNRPDVAFPTGFKRIFDFCFRGASYHHVVAKHDGEFRLIDPQPKFKRQRFAVGPDVYSVWFPPEDLFGGNHNRAGLERNQQFKAGETIMRLKAVAGDHLFVDRFTFNFRRPERGEIIVFKTEGIKHPNVPEDQFYIKRLVGLGGEHLEIGADQHLSVNGQKLTAATPRFENVYTFEPRAGENQYFGHLNTMGGQRSFDVRQDRYMVLGDNTRNSLDSRYWGDFNRTNVIGKAAFVYWPFLGSGRYPSRFGWAFR